MAALHAAAERGPSGWRARRRPCPQVINLKAALNEKEIELLELREQHMQLVVRSRASAGGPQTARRACPVGSSDRPCC
jgi:predicted nucleic acid-binding Zn finger protein